MISDNLIKLIEDSEGWSSTPYQDSVGVWTIGYGFTHYPNGSPVTAHSSAITKEYGNETLAELLEQFINGVNAMCPNCNQNQHDALVDFAFNLGLGSLKGSTLLKLVLANPDDPKIADEFGKWVHAGGEILPGLVKRRAAESRLYFTPCNS